MKILIAPDSFKGSLSSKEIIGIVEETIYRHFKDANVIGIPIADGGEGTVEALVTACAGTYATAEVLDPLCRPITATYGIIDDGKVAVIEMAQASGIMLLEESDLDPLNTTTYGTGQLIKAALDRGIRDIIIGIGGSATNDGGMGAARAVGVRFLDKLGRDVGHGGGNLRDIATIDTSGLDSRLKECSIRVICDVKNLLTGPNGATYIYGRQKGAGDRELSILEEGMKNYEAHLQELTGKDIGGREGAGAAGGLGAALIAFFGATLSPGIETILDIIEFDKLLDGVDLVITGEGNIDGQSIYGKVPVGIGKRCMERGIPVLAIVGGMGDGAQRVYDFGIDSIMVTVNKSMCIDEAIDRAEELLSDGIDRALRMIKIGLSMDRASYS